jgi:prophage tail gpP-like protein
MHLQAETTSNLSSAKTRVQWEATVRAARSAKFKIRVQGWLQGDGQLWRPNLLVHLKSAWLGVDADLLICSVDFSLSSSGGTVTDLSLERKDAYLPEPVKKTGKKVDPFGSFLRKSAGQ